MVYTVCLHLVKFLLDYPLQGLELDTGMTQAERVFRVQQEMQDRMFQSMTKRRSGWTEVLCKKIRPEAISHRKDHHT